MDNSENKKVDWNKYLDNKTALTAGTVILAVGAAYGSFMSQDLSLVMAAAIASFNWFGK